jgi:hypothetical protein
MGSSNSVNLDSVVAKADDCERHDGVDFPLIFLCLSD